MILYVFGCIWLYSYVHNLNEWVLAIRCRFSQITFRNSRPQVFCKKIPVLEFLFNKFCRPLAYNFIKKTLQIYQKDTLAQVFSCKFCEIFKNKYFAEQLWILFLYFRAAVLGYMRNIHWKIMQSFFNMVYNPIKILHQRRSPKNCAKPVITVI